MALAPTRRTRAIFAGRRIGNGFKRTAALCTNTHVENISVANGQLELTKSPAGKKKRFPLESPHTNQFRQFITSKPSPFAVAGVCSSRQRIHLGASGVVCYLPACGPGTGTGEGGFAVT